MKHFYIFIIIRHLAKIFVKILFLLLNFIIIESRGNRAMTRSINSGNEKEVNVTL